VNLENFQLTEGSSLRWRWDAWIAYLSLLGKDIGNWIFGLGVGTQRFILHPDYPNSLWRLFDAPGTHNDFLAVLIDFGLLGVGLFVGGIVLLFRVIKHAERRDESLYFMRYYLITVLFIMLSENYIDQLIMFVFVVFLMAIIRAKDETASSDDKLLS
jgi:O-antigen ligase